MIFGGEDVALEKIEKSNNIISLNIYKNSSSAYALFKFMFSLSFLFYVIKNRTAHHVICNPFPDISILSVIMLSVLGIKLRLFVHDFSASCPASTHFAHGAECHKFFSNRWCLRSACVPSKKHYLLSLCKNYLFYSCFMCFKKNKLYFVGKYQKKMALQAGYSNSQCIIVGNVND